jgi:hypothetical protein
LVEKAAPDAQSSLKWGMPCFSVAGSMMCMLGGHKTHVNLVMVGPEGTFTDPQGRLEGGGKDDRHLKLRTLDELPRAAVLKWVRAAAKHARSKEKISQKRSVSSLISRNLAARTATHEAQDSRQSAATQTR